MIGVSIAGLAHCEDTARCQLACQIAVLAGSAADEAIQAAMQASAALKTTGIFAAVIGTAELPFEFSETFAELKNIMNPI